MSDAINSLDPHTEGFNLDEFMRMVLALSAFNAAGRATNDTLENVGPKPIPKMIDHAYIETKRNFDVIRNEIEVNRLEIL